MNIKYWWREFIKVVVSVICAGIFYYAWLIVFLTTTRYGSVVEAINWLLAPAVTATGFATGIMIFERLTGAGKSGFLKVFVWPLIGCVIGAGAIYWFGPMLIVFGMFMLGTLAVVLREAVLSLE